MSLATTFQSLGLSISVVDPLCLSNRSSRSFDLVNRINGYSHELNLLGGFISASMDFFVTRAELDDWFTNGLGRDVTVWGPNMTVIFEGYVDQIDIQVGDITMGIGPLSGIGNRVLCVYTPIIDPGPPPIMGAKTETPIVDDTISQGLYGIWERDLSGGNAYEAEIEAARDTFLLDNKYPALTEQRVTPLNNVEAKITLNCKGYFEWLNAYPYTDLASGTVQASTLIKSVLSADPNGIFSSNQSGIQDVLTLTSGYHADYKKAMDVIKATLNIGDASFNRLSFQVLDGRLANLRSLDNTVYYVNRLTNAGQIIETLSGLRVFPWDIRPGYWLELPDFLIGQVTSAVKREDPRMIMIESVRYSAPYDVEVNGAKLSTLPQFLEQYGLGGLSG